MALEVRFGTATYRAGAHERINDARLLLEQERFSGAIYFTGVAVEGMLRSLKCLKGAIFDERHDLRRLASHIEHLGLLRSDGRDEDFAGIV